MLSAWHIGGRRISRLPPFFGGCRAAHGHRSKNAAALALWAHGRAFFELHGLPARNESPASGGLAKSPIPRYPDNILCSYASA